MDRTVQRHENVSKSHDWQNRKLQAAFLGYLIALAFLLLLGIIINIVVSLVMIRTRKIRKSLSNFFIFHVSVTESLFRLVFVPILAMTNFPASLLQHPLEKVTACKASLFVSSAWGSAIFLSLAGIALDRYNNILHPVRSRRTNYNYVLIVITVWSYAAVISTPFIFSGSSLPVTELSQFKQTALKQLVEDRCANCTTGAVDVPYLCDLKPGWSSRFSTTLYFFLSFFIPLLAICTAYTRIVLFLWRRSRKKVMNNTVTKSKVKAVRMMILMLLGYVLCWGPRTLFDMLGSFNLLDNASYSTMLIITAATRLLRFTSSIINPVIYAYYNSDFRRQFVREFRSCAVCSFGLCSRGERCCNSKRKVGVTKTSQRIEIRQNQLMHYSTQ